MKIFCYLYICFFILISCKSYDNFSGILNQYPPQRSQYSSFIQNNESSSFKDKIKMQVKKSAEKIIQKKYQFKKNDNKKSIHHSQKLQQEDLTLYYNQTLKLDNLKVKNITFNKLQNKALSIDEDTITFNNRTFLKIGNRTFLGSQIIDMIEYNKKISNKCGANFEYCVIRESGTEDMTKFLKKENQPSSFVQNNDLVAYKLGLGNDDAPELTQLERLIDNLSD